MPEAAKASPARAALVGFAGLASAMGIGRFAFTPLLPLMQAAGTLSLAQGGTLARANYLGYLVGALACTALNPPPGRAARMGLAAVAALTAGMGGTGSFPSWIALRLLAGVASAFVLVGVSSWALPLLASAGRAGWAGWIYSGIGVGILVGGLVGLATGVLHASPDAAWLALGACAAAVALACWRPLGAEPPRAAADASPRGALGPRTWALVFSYGAFGFGYIVPATFLPAVARQLVPDPGVFAWTWPVSGSPPPPRRWRPRGSGEARRRGGSGRERRWSWRRACSRRRSARPFRPCSRARCASEGRSWSRRWPGSRRPAGWRAPPRPGSSRQ